MTVTELVPRDGDFQRMPPHDIGAEQAALGGMMMSADAIKDVLEVIVTDDYFRPAHQMIHEGVVHLYEAGEPVNPISVGNLLDKREQLGRVGGGSYLHTCFASVPTAANAAYYARIVKERAILRRLVKAGERIAQLGYEGADDATSLVDLSRQMLEEVAVPRQNAGLRSMDELMTMVTLSLEQEAPRGLPTGFSDLDALLTGLVPGELTIVAGRPAMGKSLLVTGFASHVAIKKGLPVLISSLEMSAEEITLRLLSSKARVPLYGLTHRQLTERDWGAIDEVYETIASAPLVIDDFSHATLAHIRGRLREMARTNPAQLLIVDYLGLLSGPSRANREAEVAALSRGLKLIAREFHIPVVAAAQLNRGPEQRQDKRPMMSDLRESGCLTEDTTLLRADTGVPVTFEELMRNGTGDASVWSLDGSRRMVASPLTKVFASGVKPVYRLRLASGREVTGSGNHPFLTLGGWCRLDALAAGDRIAIPRLIPAPMQAGLGWSEHRLGLLAHLIGDGCVLRRQPVHYTSGDQANLQFVEDAAAAEFGITPRRVPQGNWWHSYLPSPGSRRNPIMQWFAELGIASLRSGEKRIPDVLYTGTQAEVATFLRHLWATDGHVAEPSSRANGSAALVYGTNSRALADGVALLLSRFGIIARIKQAHKGGHLLTITGADDLRQFASEIGVHGRRGERLARLVSEIAARVSNTNVDTLPLEVWELVKAERIRAGLSERQFQAAIGTRYCGSTLYRSGVSRARLLRCADALDSNILRSLAADDVFWDRVTEIEPLGPQPVYDATVKGTHNFLANGIVVHNSQEQDADVIILLHRQDAYEPASPRAGEIDMIVAKNRQGPQATVTAAFQGHYGRIVDMAKE